MKARNKKNHDAPHLVICDDDADDQYLIEKAIENSGTDYSVTCVDNGLQLMELLSTCGAGAPQNNLPSLIFLDLNMPLLNGYGVLQQMRELQLLGDIPVYVFSTSNLAEDKRKSLSLGARDFLTKPSDFELFKKIIREICIRHNSLRMLPGT